MTNSCQAIQYSDQMQCARCGLTWDVNDPDPPECLTKKQINQRYGREVLETLKTALSNESTNPPANTLRVMINNNEALARNYAKQLPAGPERDNVLEIAEVLHELGCRL